MSVVEPMDRERLIYTVEIDSLCVVERTDEKRLPTAALTTDSGGERR